MLGFDSGCWLRQSEAGKQPSQKRDAARVVALQATQVAGVFCGGIVAAVVPGRAPVVAAVLAFDEEVRCGDRSAMKAGLCIFLAAGITGSVFASEITLKDGRVLKDAKIVSEAPLKVTIKHAAGLGSVDKALLPAELQAQYPINEAAARAADEKGRAAFKAAQDSRKAEADRLARMRAGRETSIAANHASQENEAARVKSETEAVEADAKVRAAAYFTGSTYSRNPVTKKSCQVKITEVRPLEGWSGRWLVKGQASIKHYDDFRNMGNGLGTGVDPVPVGMTVDSANQDKHWEPDYTLEVVAFEYSYSADPKSEPAIDIKKRDERRVKGGPLRPTAKAANGDATTAGAAN